MKASRARRRASVELPLDLPEADQGAPITRLMSVNETCTGNSVAQRGRAAWEAWQARP